MRSKHIENGHEWCQLLQHTSAWVTRSVLRGIGPERQSCSFDVRRLCELPRTPAPMVKLGPCNPIHMAILATMFLLREVEATPARVSSWNLSVPDKEFTWHLPGSNSDHLAMGVRRMLPCFCDLDSLPCPLHIALDHLQWLRASRRSDGGAARSSRPPWAPWLRRIRWCELSRRWVPHAGNLFFLIVVSASSEGTRRG